MIRWILIAIAGLFLIASTMSYNSEVLLEQNYCSNVNQGIWPNYKEINCNEIK